MGFEISLHKVALVPHVIIVGWVSRHFHTPLTRGRAQRWFLVLAIYYAEMSLGWVCGDLVVVALNGFTKFYTSSICALAVVKVP